MFSATPPLYDSKQLAGWPTRGVLVVHTRLQGLTCRRPLDGIMGHGTMDGRPFLVCVETISTATYATFITRFKRNNTCRSTSNSFSIMAVTNCKTCSYSDPVAHPRESRHCYIHAHPITQSHSQPAAKCSSCFSHRALTLHTPSSSTSSLNFFLLCGSATTSQDSYDRLCYFAGVLNETS